MLAGHGHPHRTTQRLDLGLRLGRTQRGRAPGSGAQTRATSRRRGRAATHPAAAARAPRISVPERLRAWVGLTDMGDVVPRMAKRHGRTSATVRRWLYSQDEDALGIQQRAIEAGIFTRGAASPGFRDAAPALHRGTFPTAGQRPGTGYILPMMLRNQPRFL